MRTKIIKAGNIYAIPLFLPGAGIDGDMKENCKNYAKEKFQDIEYKFAYCRIIEDLGASGILVEVFNVVGNINRDFSEIVSSDRLFHPIMISGLGIRKRRWKLLYDDPDYDAEQNSSFSEIKLVKGIPPHLLELWQNHALTPITEAEAHKYDRWRIYYPTDIEEKIKSELKSC